MSSAGTPDLGTGADLTFTGITVHLTNISMSGISRESIDTTHLLTTVARTSIPTDLYEPGSIECEFLVDTTTPVTTQAIATFMTSASASWSMAVGSIGTWSGSNAYCTDFNQSFPNEELATGSFTLKVSGAITTSDT